MKIDTILGKIEINNMQVFIGLNRVCCAIVQK